MKSGSKYYPLYEYLQRCAEKKTSTRLPDSSAVKEHNPSATECAPSPNAWEIVLTFSEIETILQKSLPTSAGKRAWWSNRDSASALQASAWIQAGYHVASVDFEQQQVIFQPFTAEYHVEHMGDSIVWNGMAVKALRQHMQLTQAKFAQELGVRRQTVSEWENGVYEPDRSTAKHLALVAQQSEFE